jgi:diketogulonate reductase-like aldo/keto reductase
MYEQGLTKSLSVSNFSPAQLDCVLEFSTIAKPVVNQLPYSVAYHPGNPIDENRKRGILVQAWAPVGGSLGGRFNSSLKGACAQIGEKYDKSFAQVRSMQYLFNVWDIKSKKKVGKTYNFDIHLCTTFFITQVALRWIIQTGGSFTTQSKRKEHFAENLDIFDFELTPNEMNTLNSLAQQT